LLGAAELSGGYNYDSTAIRPRYYRSTTNITTGLLNCGLNKQVNMTAAS